MNYFNTYMEELLDGEIHGFNNKSLVEEKFGGSFD